MYASAVTVKLRASRNWQNIAIHDMVAGSSNVGKGSQKLNALAPFHKYGRRSKSKIQDDRSKVSYTKSVSRSSKHYIK